jgi:hypothetical protein
MELTVRLPVIGVVRTSHHELETTPIQAGLNRAEHGTLSPTGTAWTGSPDSTTPG